MSSIMTTQMSDSSRVTVILRDNSIPCSSVDLRGANNGGHGGPPHESGCSSPEGRMSVSTPAIDNGGASTDATSNTHAKDGSASEQHHKGRSYEAPGAMSDLLWPVPDDKPLCKDHELKIEDEYEAEGLLLITDPGSNTPAGSVAQASSSLRSLVDSDRSLVKYTCVTQSHGCNELCIGKDDRILRWRKGSTILYNIYTESFQTPGAVALVGEAMEEAISMWGGNIGVDFRRVRRDEAATFQIAYQKFPLDNDPNTYAESFFPREWASSLFVYQKGLENAAYLANILAHELGHVLGLRHEFAPEEEEDCSVRFGNKNDQSVMNYFDHASKHIVGQQDLDELAAFYAYDQAYYREWDFATDLE